MLAGLIFENIKDYKILHSSKQIIDAVIEATRIGLPSVKGYLEGRILISDHPMMQFSYPRLRKNVRRDCPAIQGEYGCVTASIWGRLNPITDRLFKKNKPRQPTRIETVDLPELH